MSVIAAYNPAIRIPTVPDAKPAAEAQEKAPEVETTTAPKVVEGVTVTISADAFKAAGAAKFLLHDVIDCCPYTIECAYSDNGMEYRGNASHPFAVACVQNNTGQKFTRIARP